ncbi:MAG TPA: response regulator, partial [Candidatus Pacearchaeota archaeon]|nr:response regulator [Candidatus Pacearchaeota archaeon]
VLKKIKSDEKLKNIKIIILSNLYQKEDIEKGLSLGADKYLIKANYDPKEVIEEIKKILNKK